MIYLKLLKNKVASIIRKTNEAEHFKKGFYCQGHYFNGLQSVKPKSNLTKVGRLNLFAYMDSLPVKIYECNNEKHAQYIEKLSNYHNKNFPAVYIRSDKYLVVEWVQGEELEEKSVSENRLNDIAKLQVSLHSNYYTSFDENIDTGFDYIDFLINRLNKYKGIIPLSSDIKSGIDIIKDKPFLPSARICHPDFTIANLIKCENTLKLVDNEILTFNNYYHIDIFNTLYSIKDRNIAIAYLKKYIANGGDLTPIIKHKQLYSIIWKIRLIGSRAQSGDYNKVLKLSNLNPEKVAEPIISIIEGCQ